jgi:hypothetical protein
MPHAKCLGPIPDYLAQIQGYAEHQAWLRDENECHHEPGAAVPERYTSYGARFDGASFDGAHFVRAGFDGASFDGASFDGASFDGASFDGARFVDARFDGARFVRARFDKETVDKFIKDFSVPVIPDLDRQLLGILSTKGNSLYMEEVHQCATTHCRSGWYCTFAAEGARLEKQLGWWLAGFLLYRAAHPDREDTPNFFASNDDAMASIQQSAEKELA